MNVAQGQGANTNMTTRFSGNCFYCGQAGHRATECRKKKAAEMANIAMENDPHELVFSAMCVQDERKRHAQLATGSMENETSLTQEKVEKVMVDIV